MQDLQERILRASHDLAHGVIKVDSFLNHQVDPDLMLELGREFARVFADAHPTKILTVETGGIAPAFATAAAFHVPLVIARKRRSTGMPREVLTETTLSQARNQIIELYASPEFITPQDRALIIDDFLTNAQRVLALTRLAQRGGAQVVGVGVVIEKIFEGGRSALNALHLPIHAIVRIAKISESGIEFG